MTEEEKTQSALPLNDQPNSEEQPAAAKEDAAIPVEESSLPETANIEKEETVTAESDGEPEDLTKTAETGKTAPAIEIEASKIEDQPTEKETEKKFDPAEKSNRPKSDRPQPKTIAAAVVALLIIIAVIWLIVGNMGRNSSTADNNSVKVSTAVENGKVSIIEEVPEEIQVNVTSADVPVWPKTKIIAYYSNTIRNADANDCSQVEPLEREIDEKFDSNIINTVNGLLEPLSSAEKAAGYYSALPLGTRLKYVKLDGDGTLEVNFDYQLGKAAGSCAVTAIRSQITNTLMQFAQVQSVKICVDGNCQQDQILQP
ncbi:MAG: GerMN domain-containing protein [Candidatus Buchananbacteria bacterium]